MISIRGATLCAATFSLLACALWVLNTAAARTFLCTFRNLCLFQKIVEVVAASLEDGPSEPTPTRPPTTLKTPPSPPRIREGVVAPAAAHGMINVNDYPSDVWTMCLRYVDLASLVNVEMAAKTLPAQLAGALNGAWDDQDRRIDPSVRAEGETARDRAIGSCPAYRRQLMARYAKAVEAAKPSGNHAVQASLGTDLGDEHELYVRISDRKGQTYLGTFLAGGVVKSGDLTGWMPWTTSEANSIFLEFSKDDLRQSTWPSMCQFLDDNSKGFVQQHLHAPDTVERGMVEALGDAAVTAVAIHRTTLSLSIVVACDNITDAKRYDVLSYDTDPGLILQASTDHALCINEMRNDTSIRSMSMNVSSWDAHSGSKAGRFVTFYSMEGRLGINVSTEPVHGRRCHCVHRLSSFRVALALLVAVALTFIQLPMYVPCLQFNLGFSLACFLSHFSLVGSFRCMFHASSSIWGFLLRVFFPIFSP